MGAVTRNRSCFATISASMIQALKRKRGIILGGSGLIGGGLVHHFNKYCSSSKKVFSPDSKILNLGHKDTIERYIYHLKPDFIINAAIATINSSPQLCYSINYQGAIHLARIALKLNIPYIFISSAATLPAGLNITEDQQIRLTSGLSSYAKSKLMAELTLKHMQEQQGLDFTGVRLGIVYGIHDHKTQGFQRMLHSIAGQTMPFFLTSKGVRHSYSNAKKVPFFIQHALDHRDEFSGNIYNFVDPEPVELVHLIQSIKTQLGVKKPRNIFLPLGPARLGSKALNILLKWLSQLGIDAKMPAELMFLNQFYKTQTLDFSKLSTSSFIDPSPKETIYSELEGLIDYYITRWVQHNQLSGGGNSSLNSLEDIQQFVSDPGSLLKRIHKTHKNPVTASEKSSSKIE